MGCGGGECVGVGGVVGGVGALVRPIGEGVGLEPLKLSAMAGGLTGLVSGVFVGMCVNSFIQARRAREAGAKAGE